MDISDENYEIARVYLAARTHWITNGKEIIDIDIRAVKVAMDIYGVKNQKNCYERVRNLFNEMRHSRLDKIVPGGTLE